MDAWTLRVCDELERRLDEPQLIERMADACALSTHGFAERFADATGIFPDEYLRRIRLARAKVLLERTSLSIDEVIVAVGFADAAGFETAFRYQHGLSPAALRRRAWGTRDADAYANEREVTDRGRLSRE